MCLAGQFVESEIGKKQLSSRRSCMRMMILGRAFQLPQSTETEYTWRLSGSANMLKDCNPQTKEEIFYG